jgi:hypothetical protein
MQVKSLSGHGSPPNRSRIAAVSSGTAVSSGAIVVVGIKLIVEVGRAVAVGFWVEVGGALVEVTSGGGVAVGELQADSKMMIRRSFARFNMVRAPRLSWI